MLDRTVAPPVQPLASVKLPAADVFSLPNGARLHILRNDAQPVVRLQVVFNAGKWYEPTAGVSLLTARMLLEGTRTRSARQIADEIAFYGASLECEQGFDRATLTLYCLTRHLEKLLPLVLDVLTEPTFPEAELAQLQTRTVQNVRVERQKASYLAAEQFSCSLFGSAHPYGRKFDETAFQQIQASQLREFHHHAYNFNQAEIFLCGDIPAEQERSVLQQLGSVQGSASHLLMPSAALPVANPNDEYVSLSGSTQASLRIGRLWPSLHHPDTHRLQVLVKVLGGYFGSRLMKNIREDKGFTYGIYASLGPREHATSFVIGSDVNAASSETAIQEVQYELRRLQQELIPDSELQTVKNYITGKFANELSTVFEQCDKYMNVVLQKLPADYYENFVRNVHAVSAEELLHLAKQFLTPEDMLYVVAGPEK